MKNNDEDLVSIITPTYNSSKFISDTIRSIQAQSYNNWELLITDDCSNDNTVAIIKEFISRDKRIKLFQLKTNSGAGVARNNSIKESSGRFIAFCDSDDRWTKDKLETQVSFMKKNDIGFSYGSYLICDEKNNQIGKEICISSMSYPKILSANFVGCLTAMYDTKKVGKIYMPIIRKRQDWGLWIKVLKACKKGRGIKNPIGIYRNRQNSISSNKIELLKYHPLVYKEILNVPLFVGYLFTLFVNMPTFIFKSIRSKLLNR